MTKGFFVIAISSFLVGSRDFRANVGRLFRQGQEGGFFSSVGQFYPGDGGDLRRERAEVMAVNLG